MRLARRDRERKLRAPNGLGFVLLLGAGLLLSGAWAASPVAFDKSELDGPFLLQVNYEEEQAGQRDFMTSRSRVVRFERAGARMNMRDDTEAGASSSPLPLLAEIPIVGETASTLELDLNEGFQEIDLEEDRTGEDYYGRVERHDGRTFELLDRKMLSAIRRDSLLVFDQEARTEDGKRIVAHYYLRPYRPSPKFRPFEMKNLQHFGFYETYPRRRGNEWVLYATKFGAYEPIVFALSSSIPERYRDAVREGAYYWNRALGRTLVEVIDAPPDVRAPSAYYNVIEWIVSGEYASTSYIQTDPLTGEILHAHVFVLRETMMEGNLEEQRNHLRYIVAHETGHALGLRHNFAAHPLSTVMDYFSLAEILEIGRLIGADEEALPYDRDVMRHVYFGEPLDVNALPAFCTDGQRGCSPFPSLPPSESLGIKGSSQGDNGAPEVSRR